MKKSLFASILLMATVAFTGASVTYAKSNKKAPATVVAEPNGKHSYIKFDTLRIDMGKFPASDPVRSATFKFKNTGDAPLVIHQAMASCGCTVPSYSDKPIPAGQTGEIKVSYNGAGKFPGPFQKTITVRSNAKNELVRLTIMGEMTEK